MTKVDFKKKLKHLYLASAKGITTVDVPPRAVSMDDAEGNPSDKGSAQADEALFCMRLQIRSHREPLVLDYAVMPVEDLWWADDMSVFTSATREAHMDDWHSTIVVLQPDVGQRHHG